VTPPNLHACAAPPPRRASAKRIGFGSRLSSWDLKLSPYLYISPFFILFLVVGLFPIGYTAVISFMDWDLVRNSGTFVGFDQYATVIADPKFWRRCATPSASSCCPRCRS
jgi:ABC-type polysaccharide transport system permease subunit